MTDSYIYGYIRPNYAASSNTVSALSAIEQYGKIVLPDTGLYLLSKGCAGLEVMTLQKILSASGYKGADGKLISIDKTFGVNTQYAVKQMQKDLSIESDGYVWARKRGLLCYGNWRKGGVTKWLHFGRRRSSRGRRPLYKSRGC